MARVAVIGAGAAGIAAARDLVAAGLEVAVFEARGRVGGRLLTDRSLARHPVELGAEFIHGERVATWDWVHDFDARTTGAAHAYEMWFHLGGALLSRADAAERLGVDPLEAPDALERRWAVSGRSEGSLASAFALWPEVSSRPLTPEGRALLENVVAQRTASDVEDLGTHRRARSTALPERLRHFRLLEGYSRLIEGASAGLEIRLGEAVERIRWDDSAVEVTAAGERSAWDRAVVTLPLGVLQARAVEFDPALPPPFDEALAAINAGHISKVVLRYDQVHWPPEMTFIFTSDATQIWWRPGQGRQDEEPVVTAFFGGRDAAALEDASEREAIDEASRQLAEILGQALPAPMAGRYVAWGREPFTRMGYSSLRPDAGDARVRLRAQTGVLHFAGEATSDDHASTVHGAIESGRLAAAEVLAAVNTR